MESTLSQGFALLTQVAMGISLAACAGLRAFLPLLAVGIAGRLDVIPLTRSFEWLESGPALVVFGLAVVFEVLADKVPFVDHALDVAETFVKPVAGAVVVASVVTELSPLQTTVLAIVAGSSSAVGLHLAKAKLRLVSSATTGGVGNPLLSLLEDAAAFLGTLVSLIVPLVALVALLGGVMLVWVLYPRIARLSSHDAGQTTGNRQSEA